MDEDQIFALQAAKGRIRLTMSAIRLERGLQVMLTGGQSHIGAIALAAAGKGVKIIAQQGHREGELAGEIAQTLAASLCCDIALTCGIHYDAISQDEIGDVFALAHLLATQMTVRLKKKQDYGRENPAGTGEE